MTTTSLDEIQLLIDQPADNDGLGGGHEYLAKSLLELIQTNPSAHPILLTGDWGSGKSTVINLLASKTVKTENVRLFRFDAWTHDGDPLRKAFLQSLIESLIEWRWIGSKKWNRRVDELLGRRAETRTTKEELLQPRTIFAFLLGLFVSPVIFTRIVDAIYRGASGPDPSAAFVWTMAILSVVCLVLVLSLFTGILKFRAVDEVSITYKQADQTSFEFEKLFREVIDEALGESPAAKHKKGADPPAQRVLVIVIDNLDRCADDQRPRVLSIIANFLDAASSPGKSDSFRRVWFVAAVNDKILKDDSHWEKLFQARVRLPETALFSNVQFFSECCKRAFGSNISDHDIVLLYRQFVFVDHASGKATPREIKQFLNDVVVSFKGQPQIPLLAHAVPILEEVPLTALLTEDGKQHLTHKALVENSKWQEDLLALHFRLPYEEATNVLIAPKIEAALLAGDLGGVKQFSTLPQFDGIVHFLLIRTLERMNTALSCGNAVLLINDLQLDANTRKNLFRAIAHRMSQASWREFDAHSAEGIVICLNSADVECSPAIVNGINQVGSESSSQWWMGVARLIEAFKARGDNEALAAIRFAPVRDLLTVMNSLKDTATFDTVFPLLKEQATISQALIEGGRAEFDQTCLEFMEWLAKREPSMAESVYGALAMRIDSHTLSAREFRTIMPLVSFFRKEYEYGDLIKRLVDEGKIAYWLAQYPTELGAEHALLLQYDMSPTSTKHWRDTSGQDLFNRLRTRPSEDRDLIARFAKLIFERHQYEVLVLSASEFEHATISELFKLDASLTFLGLLSYPIQELRLSDLTLNVEHIQGLQQFSDLKRLDLSKSSLTPSAVQELKTLTHLEYLNLPEFVSEPDQAVLLTALANAKIELNGRLLPRQS